MNVARCGRRTQKVAAVGVCVLLTAIIALGASTARAQTDGAVVGDNPPAASSATPDKSPSDTLTAPDPSAAKTPAERKSTAWKMLEGAANDQKHTSLRVQAMAALGMLRSQDSERLIGNGMLDNDADVRTAAALAAGETHDPNLSASLRNLLDDKEPQVAFAAAMTLSKMGDRSGEDILMAVADGDRKSVPGVIQGTQHKINRELHNPAKLAKLGLTQGAYMLLGPFGFGLTAIEYMRQSGGDAARAAAIEQIALQKTEPIHRELLDALKDKDAAVRAAAAKALIGYTDQPTRDAVYMLLLDPKDPVRLTASAAYLRLDGVPGPLPLRASPQAPLRKKLPARPTARKKS
jgi:HEAT repeat protein